MAQQPKKPALPSIDDELTATPRKRVDLKAIRPKTIVDDDAVSENSRRMGEEWGASTSMSPEAGEMEGKTAQHDAPPVVATPIASLRIEVPIYLDDELRVRAAAAGVTKQFLVMQALAAAGYTVRPEDLVADRRKARRIRT